MFTHGFMHTHGFTIPYIADGKQEVRPLKKSQTVSGPNGIRTNTQKTQSTGSSELRKPDDVLMHVATPWAVGSGVLLDITMRETQLIQSKF